MKLNYKVRLKNKFYKLNHLRAFKVKYLGATDFKGSRVKIIDLRHLKSTTIPYNYKYDNIRDIAIDYLLSKNIKINSFIWDEINSCYYLNTLDFKTQINNNKRS